MENLISLGLFYGFVYGIVLVVLWFVVFKWYFLEGKEWG